MDAVDSPSRRVLLLGATGMLGSMVADVLARDPGIRLTVTARDPTRRGIAGPARDLECLPFDAESEQDALPRILGRGFDLVINAIGLIKPLIHESDPTSIRRAVLINALLPHRLASAASDTGTGVIQIATDCVYSGSRGAYCEDAAHDPLDVYGKTKSLGEIPHPLMHHVRCSIIGPEIVGKRSLLEWFLAQSEDAHVTGYSNHRWNGVTTYHFARLCQGIIHTGLRLPPVAHVVPDGVVTKADMLDTFAVVYDRRDMRVERGTAPLAVDRTLSTLHEEVNRALWSAAGYTSPPSFRDMMAELADHPFNRW